MKTADAKGKLAHNILYFARSLRAAGMRVGPAAAVDAVRAVEIGGISNRDDFFWTLHSVLVNRHEDFPVFDEAFRLFWRSRELVEKMLQMFSPVAAARDTQEERRAGQTRVADALFAEKPKAERENPMVEFDAQMSASGREILRRKDFAQMTAAEIAIARRALADLAMPADRMITRRFEPVGRPAEIDARRTLSSSMRTGGDIVLPKFRRRRRIHPPIVVLADISGSMGPYTRLFLHFLHALTEKRRRVHTFLFGTRLTNVTRQLRMKDPDEALVACSDSVEDWSGGTRIGSALSEFNRVWSRRVLGQGATVLLITDGLERDSEDVLDAEMDRLQRSCRRLIWLNPLLRFEGFEAKARGIRIMLRHVDEFRAVHSLDAIADLCAALGKPADESNRPGNWLRSIAA